MSSKAVSKEHKCDPWKIGLDRNPYIQVDIDRLISYMEEEVVKGRELLDNHEGTLFEDHPQLLTEVERTTDFYVGILGMIKANSFK